MSLSFNLLDEYSPNYWKDTLREKFVEIVGGFDLKNIFIEDDSEEVFLEKLDQELASFLEDSDTFDEIDAVIENAYDLGHDEGYESASEVMYTQEYIDQYFWSNEAHEEVVEELEDKLGKLEDEFVLKDDEVRELTTELESLRALVEDYKKQYSFLENDLQTFKQKVKADYIAELEAE